eukprot:scaffold222079_cov19-Tisochrysis_lutea.AAC.2
MLSKDKAGEESFIKSLSLVLDARAMAEVVRLRPLCKCRCPPSLTCCFPACFKTDIGQQPSELNLSHLTTNGASPKNILKLWVEPSKLIPPTPSIAMISPSMTKHRLKVPAYIRSTENHRGPKWT